MPAAFILIMSLVLRDTYNIDRIGRVTFAVLDLDQSEPSRQLAGWLTPTASAPASIAELEQRLRAGTVGAGIVIEAGYAAALKADKVEKPVLVVLADTATRPEVMAALRGRIEARIAEQRTRMLLNSLASISILLAEDLGAKLAAVPPAALMSSTQWMGRHGRRALTATQQNVPAWLVFGMFFVVIPICNVFIREKQHGTLARLATLRVSLPLLLAGKILPYALINIVQTVLMLLVGRFLVPLLGGEPLPLDINWAALAFMAMSVSAAAIGFALLVAAVARTTEHATVLGGLANILFGAIGGIMVPRAIMPPFMQETGANLADELGLGRIS